MEYNRFATAVSASFESFLAQLTSLYLRQRLQGTGLDKTGLTDLRMQAHRLQLQFVRAADTLSTDYLHQTVGGVLANASARARGASLVGSLRHIAYECVMQVMRRARGAGLKTVLGSPGGAIGQLMRAADETINFTAKDSADRTWEALKLVRFLARDFAYQAEIDAQIQSLAAEADLVQVAYMDPGHHNQGLVLSIGGDNPDHPSLASVRDSIFHPNATATLTHVRS